MAPPRGRSRARRARFAREIACALRATRQYLHHPLAHRAAVPSHRSGGDWTNALSSAEEYEEYSPAMI
jgi:hypothetical protein